MKLHKWIISGIVLLIIAGAGTAGYILSRPHGNMLYASVRVAAIPPDEADGGEPPDGAAAGTQGLLPDARFSVTAGYRVTEAELRAMLAVEPAMGDYKLEGKGKRWQLIPSVPLEGNRVYTVRVKNPETGEDVQSFAFQTRSDLLVSATYPMHDSTYVDTTAGIEITFNAEDVAPENHIQIRPETAGKFTVSGYTAVFRPDAPLTPESIYRITVKAGLTAPNGMTLKNDVEFSFETTPREQETGTWFSLAGDFSETFVPGDPLAVGIYAEDGYEAAEYDVSVHRYGGIDGYIKEVSAYREYYDRRFGEKTEYVVATDGLEEVVSYTGQLYRPNSEQALYYAMLPDDMEKGCYAVTISGKDPKGKLRSVQKLLQISDISVYSQASDGETLVWLNDTESGGARAGARIEISGLPVPSKNETESRAVVQPMPEERIKREAVTQADGTARVMTAGLTSAYLTVYTADGMPEYFAPIRVGIEPKPRLSERYYSALYTEREIYKPSDTVQMWGVIRPRRDSSQMPEAAYAVLTGWDYENGDGELCRVRMPISSDGTYTAQLPLDRVEQGTYTLRITDGEKGIYRESTVRVGEYEKPPFVITVETDKEQYFMNEPITFKIGAAYYDGTPLANGELSLSGDYIADAQIQLDAQGRADYTAAFTVGENQPNWSPNAAQYTVSSLRDEDIYVSGSCRARLLPSRFAARIKSDSPDSVTVETALLDLSRINDKNEARPLIFYDQYELLAGAKADVPVTIEVKKTVTNKTPNGSYYDYVNKRTVTNYKYDFVTTVAQTIAAKTENGAITLSGLPFENTGDVSYMFEAMLDGGTVGAVRVTSGFYPIPRPSRHETKSYHFGKVDSTYVNVGDSVTLGLYEGGELVPNEGRLLYSAVQRKILKQGISTENTITETMTGEFMPNVSYCGAYFDGRHVYDLRPYRVNYDPDNKKLNVAVTTDKTEYLPREKAKISLLITDRDGRPVSGSACIGVVDEAVFAVAPQELNLTNQIYETIYNDSIVCAASYNEYQLDGTRGAMKTLRPESAASADFANVATGGGGDVTIRSEFIDTALFAVVSLDEQGRAQTELTLPDNLTAWRVTAGAVTDKLEAGQGTTAPVTTLPFYLRPLVTKNYLAGDDVAISVSAVGSSVKKNDAAEYTAVISDAAGKEVDRLSASAKIGERVPLNFGKYDAGEYTITISGKSGGLADTVREEFAVIKSGIVAPIVRNMPLAQVGDITPARYPVQLQIYDERMSEYMDMLARLSARTGDRTETLAAASAARETYEKLFGAEDRGVLGDTVRDPRLSRIQSDEDGGVRMLEKAESDIATTAKLLVAAPELISEYRAVEYLKAALKEPTVTPDERALANMGFAAAKQPVMLDLTRILSEDTTLTSRQRLYCATGLAKLGDFDGARKAYAAIRKGAVVDGDLRYFDDGGSIDDRSVTTAAAAMLTSIISHPDAESYMRFLNMQDNDRARSPVLTDLEQLACIRGFVPPDIDSAARFTFTGTDGKPQTETLERGYKSMTLSRKGLEAAQFTCASGKVNASVRYLDYAGQREESDSRITVTKSYAPVSGELKTAERALVTITVKFAPDAPEGSYVMTDYIPSGMRYLCESPGAIGYDYRWGGMENEGQIVRGYINYVKPEPFTPQPEAENTEVPSYREALNPGYTEKVVAVSNPDTSTGEGDVTSPGEYSFKYFVSASLAGEFVTESVYITPDSDGIAAHGERGSVVIK